MAPEPAKLILYSDLVTFPSDFQGKTRSAKRGVRDLVPFHSRIMLSKTRTAILSDNIRMTSVQKY